MLIDEVDINVRAGSGGDGAVAFNTNKNSLGPSGGNGGRGGKVIFFGVSDLAALEHYRREKKFSAQDGERGRKQFVDGKDGEDLMLPVPVGTAINNQNTGEEVEILKIDQQFIVARGGRGGKGNLKYRSSSS
jgi:GTP-binding protein